MSFLTLVYSFDLLKLGSLLTPVTRKGQCGKIWSQERSDSWPGFGLFVTKGAMKCFKEQWRWTDSFVSFLFHSRCVQVLHMNRLQLAAWLDGIDQSVQCWYSVEVERASFKVWQTWIRQVNCKGMPYYTWTVLKLSRRYSVLRQWPVFSAWILLRCDQAAPSAKISVRHGSANCTVALTSLANFQWDDGSYFYFLHVA